MRYFTKKNVLITGTNSGIGLALVEYFRKNDANVIAVTRSKNTKKFSGVYYINADIIDYKQIIEKIQKKYKTIDILINNAGEILNKELLDCNIEDINKIFTTNFTATLMLTNSIAKIMIEQKTKGIIINNISFSAKMPAINYGLYAASKAALESITKSLAAELAPYKIRVNGFSPGIIETKMTKENLVKNPEKVLMNIASNRVGLADEICSIVGFLSSDDSKLITGANIDASGGKFIVQNADQAWKKMED